MFKRFVLLMLASVLPVHAATVTVELQAEKAQYRLGQTVNWYIVAGASSGDNRGVSLLSVSISESTGETLNLPAQGTGELLDTEFGIAEGFTFYSPGTKQGASGVSQMYVMQMPASYITDIANDGLPHLLAKGSYTVTKLGEHQLNLNFVAANYLNETAGGNGNPVYTATAFENVNITSLQFGVYRRSDINYDGHIDINDLAALADMWLQEDAGLDADIYPINGDGIVDLNDFAQLAKDWLSF